MQLGQLHNTPSPGFSFVNCKRNAEFIRRGFQPPKTFKTGTTIAGVIFKDGVVLGADTRSTEGLLVFNKNSRKIECLAKNIYCCGSGNAADALFLMRMTAAEMKLHCMNTNRQARVVCASVMLKRKLFCLRNVCISLVVGGVDRTGSYIYSIYKHGSSDKVPYTTIGSGCLAAMGVFEARWKKDLSEEDAKKLVRDAISAGILNEAGSGSNIDMCVIRKDSVEYFRNLEVPNKKTKCQLDYSYAPGTTNVLSTLVRNFDITEQVYSIS